MYYYHPPIFKQFSQFTSHGNHLSNYISDSSIQITVYPASNHGSQMDLRFVYSRSIWNRRITTYSSSRVSTSEQFHRCHFPRQSINLPSSWRDSGMGVASNQFRDGKSLITPDDDDIFWCKHVCILYSRERQPQTFFQTGSRISKQGKSVVPFLYQLIWKLKKRKKITKLFRKKNYNLRYIYLFSILL